MCQELERGTVVESCCTSTEARNDDGLSMGVCVLCGWPQKARLSQNRSYVVEEEEESARVPSRSWKATKRTKGADADDSCQI